MYIFVVVMPNRYTVRHETVACRFVVKYMCIYVSLYTTFVLQKIDTQYSKDLYICTKYCKTIGLYSGLLWIEQSKRFKKSILANSVFDFD